MLKFIRLASLASVLLWAASLILPAIAMGPFKVHGWQFLVYGWQGLLDFNIGGVSWLANPLLIMAWVGLIAPAKYRLHGLTAAYAALIAALLSFLFNLLGGAEGGLIIEDYGLGFYLWLLATLLQTVVSQLHYSSTPRS